ncbi:MAG: AraC family transcriptional regulator [Planctomycetota bacterium]
MPTTNDIYADRLVGALVLIERRLDDPPGLDELARVSHYSPHHFHHVFSAAVGEPVSAYVRRVRLERAASKLVHTEVPVHELAVQSGFDSAEGFSRAFKAVFGASPAQFRERLGDNWLMGPGNLSDAAVRLRVSARIRRPDPVESRVSVEHCEAMTLAGLRHTGPYHRVGVAWCQLMLWATAHRQLSRDSRHIGIAHDDPAEVSPRKLRYDACITPRRPFKPGKRISRIEYPAVECAVADHAGPYDTLPETYEHIYGVWLPASGYEPADEPSFCEFTRSQRGSPRVARVYVPVRPLCDSTPEGDTQP